MPTNVSLDAQSGVCVACLGGYVACLGGYVACLGVMLLAGPFYRFA